MGRYLSNSSVITESTEIIIMNLSSIHQTFVIYFGELGARWGVNYIVSQISGCLAYLY